MEKKKAKRKNKTNKERNEWKEWKKKGIYEPEIKQLVVFEFFFSKARESAATQPVDTGTKRLWGQGKKAGTKIAKGGAQLAEFQNEVIPSFLL